MSDVKFTPRKTPPVYTMTWWEPDGLHVKGQDGKEFVLKHAKFIGIKTEIVSGSVEVMPLDYSFKDVE